MAMTIQQRRRRTMIIATISALVLVLACFSKAFIQQIISLRVAGYAQHAPAGTFASLDWSILHKGQWDLDKKPVIPQPIVAENGKPVCLKGFLLPLHSGTAATQFYISAKPRGCYFCSPPGIAEVALINVANNKQLPWTDWPVQVYGKLKVTTGAADDQTMYTIDDASIVVGG